MLYPPPVFVRNTFLDCEPERSPSFDDFFRDRQVCSCPVSLVSDAESTHAQGSDCSTVDTAEAAPSTPELRTAVFALTRPKLRWSEQPDHEAAHEAKSPGRLSTALAPAAPAPPVVTEQTPLPSVGSAGHHLGQCKPCAFVGTKGCVSGAECLFCHLCERGEKKRRQKAKRAEYGMLQHLRQILGAA